MAYHPHVIYIVSQCDLFDLDLTNLRFTIQWCDEACCTLCETEPEISRSLLATRGSHMHLRERKELSKWQSWANIKDLARVILASTHLIYTWPSGKTQYLQSGHWGFLHSVWCYWLHQGQLDCTKQNSAVVGHGYHSSSHSFRMDRLFLHSGGVSGILLNMFWTMY